MDRPELLDDERFVSRPERHAHRDEMLALFQEFASTFTNFEETLHNIAGDEEGEFGKHAAKLRASHPFTPPADGRLTEHQVQQFIAVKHAFDPEERINAGKLMPSEKVKISLIKPGRHVPQ